MDAEELDREYWAQLGIYAGQLQILQESQSKLIDEFAHVRNSMSKIYCDKKNRIKNIRELKSATEASSTKIGNEDPHFALPTSQGL